jgi:hypothetical protein
MVEPEATPGISRRTSSRVTEALPSGKWWM